MTLVEFLEPLRKSGSRSGQVLGAMLFAAESMGKKSLGVADIRQLLKSARISKALSINISDVLSKLGANVHEVGTAGRAKLWSLTSTGERQIRELLGLPAQPVTKSSVSSSLQHLIGTAKTAEIRDYLEEALRCLSIDARRAFVVFVWSGAIRDIHDRLLSVESRKLNEAIKRHYLKAKDVSALEHFAYIEDSLVLKVAQDLLIFDKSEKGVLEEALNLRNRCGHPGKYQPSNEKVAAFFADLMALVFAK